MNTLILLLTGGPECGWAIGIMAVIMLLLGRYAIVTLPLQFILGIKTSTAAMVFWAIVMIACILGIIFT